jgi:D-beta-D-heptose 7-phosphate kinase/D-beta-D-heptose 1-phosphate adenosyltransferase
MFTHTILEFSNVLKLIKKYRAADKTIVLTQGSFDMVHIGHARYLAEAKRHGNVLFVGVDSDEKIRERKGSDRPIVPQDERLEMLTYLKPVDHVVLKELDQPKWELIKLIRPDVLIATAETYSEAQLAELRQWCAKVVVLDPMATTSTSAKIRRVQLGYAKHVGNALSEKLIHTIEEVLEEFKQQK